MRRLIEGSDAKSVLRALNYFTTNVGYNVLVKVFVPVIWIILKLGCSATSTNEPIIFTGTPTATECVVDSYGLGYFLLHEPQIKKQFLPPHLVHDKHSR